MSDNNKEKAYEWYGDFPTSRIRRGNPYSKCSLCGISVPEINYRLDGHHEWCPYRLEKEREIALNASL